LALLSQAARQYVVFELSPMFILPDGSRTVCGELGQTTMPS